MRPYLLAPRFAANRLWLAAREVPSWHIAPVRTGTVTDLISGSQIITFTNSSPAWGFNSSGVLVQPAANVPFIEYDPATGSALGWRVWDAVTNNWNYTEDFTNSYWTKTGGSITANVGPSPDGDTNADGFVETTGVSETHGFQRNYSFVAGTQVAQSVFVSKGSRNFAVLAFGTGAFGGTTTQAFFDLTLGTITQAVNCTAQVQVCPNGILRCSITATPTVTTTSVAAYRATNASGSSIYTGNGSTAAYFWGAQLNTGPLAPYVPATGALTASSTADVASISGAAFAGIYREDEATLFASWLAGSSSASRYLLDIEQAASNSNRIDININASNTVNPRTVVSGTSLASLSGGTYTAGTIAAIAFAYKAGDYASSLNGASVVTNSTAGSLPASPSRLFIGSLSGNNNFINGYIRDMAILKSRRPNANLQSMTQ